MTESGSAVEFWGTRRVLVTGGAGFLGSHLVGQLRKHGAGKIFVPRKVDYDLVNQEDVRRVLADSKPDIVVHLAAKAGGIGANRSKPAEFFYDNQMMVILLLHEAWSAQADKLGRKRVVWGKSVDLGGGRFTRTRRHTFWSIRLHQ